MDGEQAFAADDPRKTPENHEGRFELYSAEKNYRPGGGVPSIFKRKGLGGELRLDLIWPESVAFIDLWRVPGERNGIAEVVYRAGHIERVIVPFS